ncbi:metal-dependent hydrolase [Acuticoccus sp. M5D2P5]|uniref:metal-dependent hydrolase n=1 Tax=Acuticoccus kalidii TaxID=2910977 RepID=UPI001F3A1331|nr:metal-dependent hydrolase [Acuticoccus kalidii]MCF3936061.1 metal-dependent hydrolase [Acuticoccus kalidii]
MRLTWYGHSAFRLDFGSTSLLIDPFLTDSPKWDGGWEEPAQGISHLLLTHGHDDHLGDTSAILGKTGAQLVSSAEVCTFFARQGHENVNPGNHGGTLDCGEFTVSFVNALHSSSSMGGGDFVYLGNPLGLVITPKADKTVYAMGDTGIFGDMALVNELYSPAVGLVPIGDRFTMGAKQAALACKRYFQFETIVPCHYGTFPILDQTADKFLAEMGSDAAKVTVPEIGVPFDV